MCYLEMVLEGRRTSPPRCMYIKAAEAFRAMGSPENARWMESRGTPGQMRKILEYNLSVVCLSFFFLVIPFLNPRGQQSVLTGA